MSTDEIDDDLLAAARDALREGERLAEEVRELIDKRDADLVAYQVQLGRALRKWKRHEGAAELRSLLQTHAAQGGKAGAGALEQLAAEDPWWSERK
jgi:hypothetical protein